MRDLFRPLAVSVHVVDIAKYADTLSALVCRPPAFEVVHEDAPELRKESEGATENQAFSIILESIEDHRRCQSMPAVRPMLCKQGERKA